MQHLQHVPDVGPLLRIGREARVHELPPLLGRAAIGEARRPLPTLDGPHDRREAPALEGLRARRDRPQQHANRVEIRFERVGGTHTRLTPRGFRLIRQREHLGRRKVHGAAVGRHGRATLEAVRHVDEQLHRWQVARERRRKPPRGRLRERRRRCTRREPRREPPHCGWRHIDWPRQPKVTDLEGARLVEQTVLRLEVAVDDGRLERVEETDARRHIQGEPAAAAPAQLGGCCGRVRLCGRCDAHRHSVGAAAVEPSLLVEQRVQRAIDAELGDDRRSLIRLDHHAEELHD
eukprot:2660905-Prymnesium_polylepis.1